MDVEILFFFTPLRVKERQTDRMSIVIDGQRDHLLFTIQIFTASGSEPTTLVSAGRFTSYSYRVVEYFVGN